MNDFVVGAMAENLDDPLRRLPGDSSQLLRTVIGEPAGEFLPSFATQGHDVPLLEVAFDPPHADRQQAAALVLTACWAPASSISRPQGWP